MGGAVRDLLLGRPLGKDFDFVVPGDASAFSKELSLRVGGHAFLLDDAFGTWRVVVKKGRSKSEIDLCALQGMDIVDDLRKRDFTINSLAIRLADILGSEKPLVIDPLGGLSDLRKKVLRANAEESFRSDPLRMLRAFRFACTLGMGIEKETLGMIQRQSSLIRKSAGERVRGELFVSLHENQSSPFLRGLHQAGLLEQLFPEIAEWEDLNQGPGHDFPLLEHAFRTVETGEFLLDHLRVFSRVYARSLEEHFEGSLEEGISRKALFKFECFFHDSGKPNTRSQGRDEKARFLDHDQEGQKINTLIARRLRLSRKSIRILSEWTRQHMRLQSLAKATNITPRAKFRFFRDLGREGLDLVFLTMANALGSRNIDLTTHSLSDLPDGLKRFKEAGEEILHYYFEEYSPKPPGLFLNGREIMETLNLPQSPRVGRLLGLLREAEINGQIHSREEALEFIKNIDISKPLG